jgi:hypothetical protein
MHMGRQLMELDCMSRVMIGAVKLQQRCMVTGEYQSLKYRSSTRKQATIGQSELLLLFSSFIEMEMFKQNYTVIPSLALNYRRSFSSGA